MTVWVVRAGPGGSGGEAAIEHEVVGIGWTELGDLASVVDKSELDERYHATYPEESGRSLENRRAQVWSFLDRIAIGDLVVVPIRHRSIVAVGEVTGGYKFRPELPDMLRHTRAVRWLNEEVPWAAFDQDLLQSFTPMTVARVQRERADERIRAIARGS